MISESLVLNTECGTGIILEFITSTVLFCVMHEGTTLQHLGVTVNWQMSYMPTYCTWCQKWDG